MSLGRPEKICSHDSPGTWKRDAKRQRNRRLRQSWRAKGDEAEIKVGYYGWST